MEALENRRAEVELEIEAIQVILTGGRTARKPEAAFAAGKRRPRTAAEKKAQSRMMKKVWARRKAEKAKTRVSGTKASARPGPGPAGAAFKRAQSLRMKAYWKKRKAAAAAKTKK